MSNQCNTLDALVGDLLPHIYCKKITLNNSANDRKQVKVTVSLEMYEERNKVNKSGWLVDLKLPSGKSILDAFYTTLQVHTGHHNIKQLRASHGLNALPPLIGNYYVLKQKNSDLRYFDNPSTYKNKVKLSLKTNVGIGSLLGDFSAKEIHNAGVFNRKAREEYKDGKWYTVVPFEYNFFLSEADLSDDVGFIFFSYLDMTELFPEQSASDDYIKNLNLEGSINTEIIFKAGSVATTRESFIAPGGKLWEGSVHYHGDENPAPDGYKGWMTGESHHPDANQIKLQLMERPNHKIVDFRDSSVIMPGDEKDEVLGLGKDSLIGVGPNYEKAEKIINFVLSPLQKEKKKDFVVDNDDEYSKLYLSRDRSNNAHGLFYINFKNLLQNNSKTFSLLSDTYKTSDASALDMSTPAEMLKEILQESKIQELRIYRDRVLPKNGPQPYKKFADNKPYEEPSRLIGRIVDKDLYKSPIKYDGQSDTSVNEFDLALAESYINRYFTFSDYEVGTIDAGLYQYRVELDFFDGTNIFINKLIKELRSVKLELEQYYKFATSGRKTEGDFTYRMNYSSESGKKIHFKPYYDDIYKSFTNEFLVDANYQEQAKPGPSIWSRAPKWIIKTYAYFIDNSAWTTKLYGFINLANLISPETGSPSGINFCIRLMDTILNKLEVIIGTTKTEKNHSDLNLINSVVDHTHTPIASHRNISSKSVVYEVHSFDNPEEIFDASIQKNIYVDYLSSGFLQRVKFVGLRAISPEDYSTRIKLEDAKFISTSDAATSFADYLGSSVDLNIYGYLTPSEIKISDATKGPKSFDFVQRAFSVTAYDKIRSANTENLDNSSLVSDNFVNYNKYDSLMISLINYNLNKKDNRNVNLATAPTVLSSNASDQEKGFKEREGVYKKFFDSMNITLHDVKKHDSYLNPRRKLLKETNEKIQFPLGTEHFSEALGISSFYFKQLMNHQDQKIVKLPTGKINPYPFSADLPNNFKLWHLKNVGVTAFHSPQINKVLEDPDSSNYNSFKFFNFNMTVKIEVFTGSGNVACNDNWELLTKDHVSLISGTETLFCRIKYYDINLVGDITMPIIDNYFLISNRAILYNVAAIKKSLGSAVLDLEFGGVNLLKSQIDAKLVDFASVISNQTNPAPQSSMVAKVAPALTINQGVSGVPTPGGGGGGTPGDTTGGTGGYNV